MGFLCLWYNCTIKAIDNKGINTMLISGGIISFEIKNVNAMINKVIVYPIAYSGLISIAFAIP
jgi:hypothetical protein